jgi:hypothetical protein
LAAVASSTPSTDPPVAAAEKAPKGLGPPALYLDGKIVGALTVPELPPSLPVHLVHRSNGKDYPKYWLGEVLTAWGIDLSKVREVHLHGGRAVGILSGAEVRRLKDRVWVTFSRGTAGKPRMEWPDELVDTTATIDLVGAITVYVDREPPKLQRDFTLRMPDGGPIEGIAYAPKEQSIKGTRILVDGALANVVKRKLVSSKALLPSSPPDAPTFSLPGYLSTVDVDTSDVKAVDLVVDDDTIARFTKAEWAAHSSAFTFSTTRHRHGRIGLNIPANTSGPGPFPAVASVSAILVWKRTPPPARTLVAFTPEPDVTEPASNVQSPGTNDTDGE